MTTSYCGMSFSSNRQKPSSASTGSSRSSMTYTSNSFAPGYSCRNRRLMMVDEPCTRTKCGTTLLLSRERMKSSHELTTPSELSTPTSSQKFETWFAIARMPLTYCSVRLCSAARIDSLPDLPSTEQNWYSSIIDSPMTS